MKPREYRYDNLRFFLMALVVLGHLLEITPDVPYKREVYYLIYSFHMPAFLFLSGIFARWDRIKVIVGMCLPYLVLQTLYIRFAQGLYAPEEAMQFSRPYWILWYLFVLAVYTLLIPLYDIASPMGRLAMVGAAVVLALAVGCDKSIGYQWSASRILVFQPWFLLGYYFKDAKRLIQRWESLDRPLKYLLTELVVLGCIVLEYGLIRWDVPEKLLYGALSYADTGGLADAWPEYVLCGQCDFPAVCRCGETPGPEDPRPDRSRPEQPAHLPVPRLFGPSGSIPVPFFV